MEAIFKIEPTEFNQKLFQNIKNMFEGKPVTITISTELDETDYLNANPANRQHLLENMAQEPTVRFTPEEFDKHVEKLIGNK
jgi:PHD/YefM family antitoxin component YafN of YafNO toxin-antitoxin module